MKYVLDACALIAFFRNEPGGELVKDMLLTENCSIHSLNLCEVYYDFIRAAGLSVAESMLEEVGKYGITLYTEENPIWKKAGRIKAEVGRLSLADCFALALGNELDATILTSDRTEFDREAVRKICRIQFIR